MTADFQPLTSAPDDALAAVGEAGARTVGELRRDVLRVVGRLPPATPGSELVVVCNDRYHFAVGVLAAWEAGHGVALPPNTQPEVVRSLGRQPQVALLLHDTDAAEGADLRGWLGLPLAEDRPLAAISAGRPVATLYTSGTTGEHQACAKTAGQLLGEAAVLAATFGVGSGDRVLATVPPHHIYGLLFGILMPILAGASFVRDTPFHAETVAATARRWAATVLVSVPVHLRSLTVLEDGALPGLHRVFSSGAPLSSATAAALIERFDLRATEVFGSSETGGIAWRLSETCREAWRPLPGIDVDVDVRGRLLLDSPFLPPTEARPYVASDRIELAEGGGFHLLGRADGIIKVGGKRVSLAEVEHRLLLLPGIVDGAIAAAAIDGARGHALMAAVVVAQPAPGEAPRPAAAWIAAIRRGLREWFDPVVVPRRIRIVERLPREANGKLRRQRLLEILELAREGSLPAPPASLATFRLRREHSERQWFAVRAHAVRRAGRLEIHEIKVRIPREVDGGLALARMLSQVIGRVAGLGRPQRMQGAGLRLAIAPGDALVLTLEVERARRRVGFALQRDGVVCTSGTVDYVAAERAPEARVG